MHPYASFEAQMLLIFKNIRTDFAVAETWKYAVLLLSN